MIDAERITLNPSSRNLMQMASDRHLFIDDSLIAASRHVTHRLVRPEIQFENLLAADQPWESGRAGVWASICHFEGQYRLWYEAYAWNAAKGTLDSGSHAVCHAVSRDGVHFEKPEFGLFEAGGTKRNNIVMRDTEGCVFLDPVGPPERRFRALVNVRGPARRQRPNHWPLMADIHLPRTWMLYSADGIHWNRSEQPFTGYWLGATQSPIWDDRLNEWILYARCHVKKPDGSGWRRAFARLPCGRDGLDRPIVLPDPRGRQNLDPSEALDRDVFELNEADGAPVVIDTDDRDGEGAQVYVTNVWKYPRASDVYLALHAIWYDRKGGEEASDGFEGQIAFSRDGIRWQRPWREPVLPLGLRGGPYGGQTHPLPTPVIDGDEILLYFMGHAHTHKEPIHHDRQGHLARAIWTLDRFAAFDASFTTQRPGELVTHPFVFAGKRLLLNMDASAAGVLHVALERADGIPIPGFTLEDSNPLYLNGIAQPAGWRGNSLIGHLAGQPVRMRFQMRACRLFGFRFEP